MATKTTAPAPPKPKLPESELADLGRAALRAWESGEPKQTLDSEGGVWLATPIRDANSRLRLTRERLDTASGELVVLATQEIGGAMLGVEDPLGLLVERFKIMAGA